MKPAIAKPFTGNMLRVGPASFHGGKEKKRMLKERPDVDQDKVPEDKPCPPKRKRKYKRKKKRKNAGHRRHAKALDGTLTKALHSKHQDLMPRLVAATQQATARGTKRKAEEATLGADGEVDGEQRQEQTRRAQPKQQRITNYFLVREHSDDEEE